MSYAQKYKNDIDGGGFEKILVNFRRKHLIDIFTKLHSRNIVEIGCGTEPIFTWFSDCSKIEIIERSSDFCFAAAEQLKIFNKMNDNIIDIFINNVSFEDCKKFVFKPDVIVLSGVLHEVDDVELFLKHLKSLISGDEYIYVNVPNANSLHRLLAFHSGIIDDLSEISKRGNYFGHKRGFFTLKELKKILIKFGFNIVDQGTIALKPFTNAQMNRLFTDDEKENNILLEAILYPDKFLPEMGSELWVLVKGSEKK